MKKIIILMMALFLVLTACNQQQNTKNNKEIKINNAVSLIQASDDKQRDVKSYSADYTNTVHDGSKEIKTDYKKTEDSNHTQHVQLKEQQDELEFYVYNKKTVINQNGQWMDVSNVTGSQLLNLVEPTHYPSQFQMIRQLKSADYRKTNNGYVLSQKINNYDDYRKLFGDIKKNNEAIDDLEKAYPEVNGQIQVDINKDLYVTQVVNQLNLKNGNKKLSNDITTSFNKINEIKSIKVPTGVKKAKKLEDK